MAATTATKITTITTTTTKTRPEPLPAPGASLQKQPSIEFRTMSYCLLTITLPLAQGAPSTLTCQK